MGRGEWSVPLARRYRSITGGGWDVGRRSVLFWVLEEGVVTGGGCRFRAVRLRTNRRGPSPTASSETIPVCRAASCIFGGSSRTRTEFGLASTNGVCNELAGSARNIFRREVTTLRNNMNTLTATSNTTTLTCAFRTLTGTNSRVITTRAVCNNACGCLRRAFPRRNIGAAFISPSSLRGFRSTVRRGAGLVFFRALNGPGSGLISVSTLTTVTRGRGVPLITSTAFAAPCLLHTFSRNISVIIRSTAGFVKKRNAALNNIVISDNGFS